MINKPKAILAVDELVRSEAIAWLDSDLLIAGDMNALALADEDDFVACTSDRYGATTGPDDPEDCYWQAVCKSLNIDIEALPWVRTEIEKIQVRLYFNSGLFVYRHDTGFAIRYLENCIRLLDSRIASKSSGLFFTDQIALGLTAFQLGFRCRSLGCSYNYPVSSGHFLRCEADRNDLTTRNVKVLHYHNSMWPPFWPEFLMSLKSNQLEVADWLEPLGPMKIESAIPTRLMGRLLRQARDKIGLIYAEGCSHF
jgi:lipopolysaccharide biosynthesis glycosyltransferase